MRISVKNAVFGTIMGVSACTFMSSATANPYNPHAKTNHYRPIMVNHNAQYRPRVAPQFNNYDRYGHQAPHAVQGPKYTSFNNRLHGRKALAHQVAPPPPGMGQFQRWVEYEPHYTLYPGDQLDIVVSSAPELSRTITVGPDGRVVMPMIKPVMAAGRTMGHVEQALSTQLATQLRDPKITVTPRAYAPQQVFVGGAVGQQGTFTMSGPMGAFEAILMAGGLRPTAKTSHVAVLRRAPNGGMMMRVVNIKNGLRNIREYNDNMQLRRGDIVFVPQSTIAEVGVWVQNFRNVLPVDFNLSYQFGNNNGGTTVISP